MAELIDRRAAIDIVIKGCSELGEDYSPKWARKDLESLPTTDAVPVVRCKDCKYTHEYHAYLEEIWCWKVMGRAVDEDWFCPIGERKIDE